MNARRDQKIETCTSESGCAASVDKESSSSTEKKLSIGNFANNIRRASATAAIIESEGLWTDKEHCRFLDGLYTYGKDWEQIAALVKSRNAKEVWRHFDSFHIQEPFLFTLRRMLEDKSLDHIIAWLPGGRTFHIYNYLECTRIALLLYFRGFFCDFDRFRREL
ncbi:hypothetical protein CTEN210_05534 [Chaetoceros tenuissimus]|uniref:SANT domain-containing protein n=1 Tax=Chaetoceros tenuissimus TaxID=426638 RepID=A0AAD3CN81_9STRA|nr:hypothetical protein CTEN210_05534 [Chaetoceros tenuissimus]